MKFSVSEIRMNSKENNEEEYVRVPKKKFIELMEDFDILLKNVEGGILEGRMDILQKAILDDADKVLVDLEEMSKSNELENSYKELRLMRRRRFSKLLNQ